MTTPRVRLTAELDVTDPAAQAAFERSFYAGFSHATHNRLVRWLWDWDHDNRRLRTRIPYAEQRIWTVTDDSGAITAAIAVNVTLRALQASAYGFACPPALTTEAADGRVCEFLTFFATAEQPLRALHALWREMFEDLAASGFRHGLATTAPKVLPMYRRMGAKEIGHVELEGEVRKFLQFDLVRRPGA